MWTAQDVKDFHLVNQKAYDASPLYSQKADILRYEILYRYGGLYADIDAHATQPFDPIHESGVTFYSAVEPLGYVVENAIFGAAPGNEILKKTIDLIGQTEPSKFACVKKYEKVDRIELVLATSGPILLTKAVNYFLRNGLLKDKTIIYPSKVLNPIGKTSAADTFAIHHYNSEWVRKK